MTTYDDSQLAAEFASLAPEPLEGRWDDVLREATTALDDRRRLKGSLAGQGRRASLLVFAAAVVVGLVTASALAVRAVIVDKGFIGVPPKGATPSTPESGELVLDFYGYSQAHGGAAAHVWVYADGRVIWDRRRPVPPEGLPPEGANELTSGYLEQRLTPDGVALLRSEVLATGLFDRSLTLILPADYGKHPWGSVQVRAGGRRSVLLRWTEPGRDEKTGQPRRFENSVIATPDQLSSLSRVDALLTDPESVLPSSAWAEQAIRAYVPSHYAVCVYAYQAFPSKEGWRPRGDVGGLLSLLPARAEDVLAGKSWKGFDFGLPKERSGTGSTLPSPNMHCAKVTTAEAQDVADALAGFEREPHVAPPSLAYVLSKAPDAPDTDNYAGLDFEPYFPHGEFIDSGP